MSCVYGRALRGNHVDGAVESFVQRDVRIDEAFQNVNTSGKSLGQVSVHGCRPLRVRSGKIKSDALPIQSDQRFDVDWLTGNAIVIQIVFGFKGTAGELEQLCTNQALAVFDQLLDVK